MGEDRRPFLQILKSKAIENGEKGQVLPVCRQPERHHAFGGASGYVSGSDVFLDAHLVFFFFCAIDGLQISRACFGHHHKP